MKNKRKLIILSSIIIGVLVVVLGLSYALFTFDRSGANQELVLGDIWMKYTESNGISLENALPGAEYSKYFEFTITGKNTYRDKDIWYDIRLTKGDVPEGKTEENRIEDKYLKFKLVEVNGDVETEIFTDKTYDDLTNQIVHVATIPKATNEYSKTYRLYMVISEELKVGNVEGAMSSEDFETLFGSIKVATTGDFTEKEVPTPSAAETIIENVATYAVASASDFSGGLVGINTDGSLYNETSTSEEVREYRYSGPSVNNYAYFNCKDTDGTYNYGDDNYDYANNCETWRIVGVFKNANDEWNLKLMKGGLLHSDNYFELPKTYIINDLTYKILSTYEYVYWNYNYEASVNNWKNSGLQYFLNTNQDESEISVPGYYSTISSKNKLLIDENYTYYLGNVYHEATTKDIYIAERSATKCAVNVKNNSHNNECNIWNGNEATWNGKVALLYPSDYGYSASSKYWVNTLLSDYDDTEAYATSWMYQTAYTTSEFCLSPSSTDKYYATAINGGDEVYIRLVNGDFYARPVLNLKSGVKVKSGDGTSNLPYVFVRE